MIVHFSLPGGAKLSSVPRNCPASSVVLLVVPRVALNRLAKLETSRDSGA